MRRAGVALRAALLLLACCSVAPLAAQAQVEFPVVEDSQGVSFGARQAHRWTQGSYEVWWLSGDVYIRQGGKFAQAEQAVLWVRASGDLGARQHEVIAYLDGKVRVEDRRNAGNYQIEDQNWLGEFYSAAPVEAHTPPPRGEPNPKPPVYERAMQRRTPPRTNSMITRTQFEQVESLPGAEVTPPPMGRRLRAFPRSASAVQVQWEQSPTGNEWVAVISPGVNLIIDGLPDVGSIDISADRIVLWTQGLNQPNLSGGEAQTGDTPLELYMEGNLVFREGDRVIYADRMYYDVTNHAGRVIDAEVLTPAPGYQGLLRLKADVLQQISDDRFVAQGAYLTGSRMASPRYRLSSNQIYFQDLQRPLFDPWSREPRIDPFTGQPQVAHDRLATSQGNTVYLGAVPVFYWPTLATNLEDPTLYLRRVQLKNDSIFGTQVYTDWNAYQLLGIRNPPDNTKWTISGDYLSERGPALGTNFEYAGYELLGLEGPYRGFFDAWNIYDTGLDVLGPDRNGLVPEQDFRFRYLGQHRQHLGSGYQLSAEFGYISDRNFLEQYFENEWDMYKDQTTGVEFKRLVENTSWALSADVRLDNFFTQTESLPRFDHFWLGESLFGDRFTWFEHTTVSYSRLRVGSTPTSGPEAPLLTPLLWEVTSSGERAVTRQEIDMPLQAGVVKIVPYALGEAAHWGEDITGEDLQRVYGQTGVRASLPIWATFPEAESELFNVHGLAHKLVFDVDASYTDASQNLDLLPLYDPIDDDSVEHFRRRFRMNTFGLSTVVPARFDERFYGVRAGLASDVTSPSAEIADDLEAVRFGLRQRWQTKRGPAGNRRIIDWIVLDTQAVYFPDAERDNFGEDFGLVQGDFRWHIGDRLTILADGYLDFFDEGLQTFSVGAVLSRPPRGALYLGFRTLEGPFDMDVVNAAFSYQLSPKWVSSGGISYDFQGSTIGNNFALTRVGESFLISMAFNFDAFKDNFGAAFMIEPRFLPGAGRRALGAVQVPVAGLYGLE